MSVSIVIAEDHALFRSGLKQLLLLGEGLEVIGEAGDGFEAVNMTVASRPDLLLLDLSMPDRDGLEVIAHVRKECPDTARLSRLARTAISSKRRTTRNSSLPSSACSGAIGMSARN